MNNPEALKARARDFRLDLLSEAESEGRYFDKDETAPLIAELADCIDTLHQRLREVEKALRPFAALDIAHLGLNPARPIWQTNDTILYLGDILAARQALTSDNTEETPRRKRRIGWGDTAGGY